MTTDTYRVSVSGDVAPPSLMAKHDPTDLALPDKSEAAGDRALQGPRQTLRRAGGDAWVRAPNPRRSRS